MRIEIFGFCVDDINGAIAVWNEVVSGGVAFPQVDCLDEKSGLAFFAEQSFVGIAKVAEVDCDFDNAVVGDIVGLYILHPNNIGRCGHICNASYAVLSKFRGYGIGEMLVSHCISKSREIGFGILQFNAVVASNIPALNLYKKLGFTQLAVIPKGFRLDDGTFADIVPHFIEL